MSLHETFTRRLTRQLANMALTYAQPAVQQSSKQLARALQLYVDSDNSARLYIPHYWALYVHDGRGPFGPRRSTYLVWFRNRLDDPRLNNGESPERFHQVKRLTKEQFRYWLGRNRQAILRNSPPPMIVTRYVPYSTPGKLFFGNEPGQGMAGFRMRVGEVAPREFSNHVKESLRDVLHVRETVTIRL